MCPDEAEVKDTQLLFTGPKEILGYLSKMSVCDWSVEIYNGQAIAQNVLAYIISVYNPVYLFQRFETPFNRNGSQRFAKVLVVFLVEPLL